MRLHGNSWMLRVCSNLESLEKFELNVRLNRMAYIRIIWITWCEYYLVVAIKISAFVTSMWHCHHLGVNWV